MKKRVSTDEARFFKSAARVSKNKRPDRFPLGSTFDASGLHLGQLLALDFWFVGLLLGLLVCWVVVLLGSWVLGFLSCWVALFLGCWVVGWFGCLLVVGLLGCWVVGLVGCWIVELDCSVVVLLVCCTVDL